MVGQKRSEMEIFLLKKTLPTKMQEPQVIKKPQLTRDKQQGKIDLQIPKPARKLKQKPSHKKQQAGKAPSNVAKLKWVLEGKKIYEAVGNKVTVVKPDSSIIEYASIAMLIEDGAAPVSGDHFWTANFGGTESGKRFFGITNSRWFKQKYGLFYSGILCKYNEHPQVEFGPVINSGDVIGALCSFSNDHLNIYFYHNGRCLGLTFQVPASLFLPEGICPCVRLNEEGAWAKIIKEPKEKIPKEKERVRAPAGHFGVEGIWRFKSLIDLTRGNEIPLNLDEKKVKTRHLTIRQRYGEPSTLFFTVPLTHYVKFYARKMDQNLWVKSRSVHQLAPRERPGRRVFDHSLYPDFPIIEILNNPEKVDFHDQDMRVTKGESTAIFNRYIKIRKGNLFKNEYFF